MGKKKQVINKDTKLKIALEAVQEKCTVEELAEKYQITPAMVLSLKKNYLKRDLFSFEESKMLNKVKKELKKERLENDFITNHMVNLNLNWNY